MYTRPATQFTAAMAIAPSSKTGRLDYKFVDAPPDRLVCNICHLPSRDPYLTTVVDMFSVSLVWMILRKPSL